jgi:hypothetical protein
MVEKEHRVTVAEHFEHVWRCIHSYTAIVSVHHLKRTGEPQHTCLIMIPLRYDDMHLRVFQRNNLNRPAYHTQCHLNHFKIAAVRIQHMSARRGYRCHRVTVHQVAQQ